MVLDVLERAPDKTLEASLLFLEPTNQKPRFTYSSGAAQPEMNSVYTPRKVTIRDARTIHASLDVEGFALVHHRSAVRDFWNEDETATTGRREAARLLRRATGAAHVHVFDHTLRRRAPDAVRQPSVRVHNDYTPRSAPQRVRDLMGPEADELLQHRVAFINVWRPIRHAALDWPLAIADARSVAPEDLVATDVHYPDRSGEIYGLTYSPRHLWYYVPDMQLDEALLIKGYDCQTGVASFTPHTAFESPLTPPGAQPRESVEFRAIAFFEPIRTGWVR